MKALRRFAILCHRWMGVAFCLLFSWWFVSGIFMMYSDYPSVGPREYLAHARAIDSARVMLTARHAAERLGGDPGPVELVMFDGRPAYRFREAGGFVYADDGSVQDQYPKDMLLRIASQWTGQPSAAARVQEVVQPDQWTLGVRGLLPLWKYTFADGQQVYVSESAGEVVQATTRGSRILAELGPIPHWLYYTPLRVRSKLWTRVVVWLSGAATVAALLGLVVGITAWWPSKRVPYTGQKRLHTILGLFFGVIACTWAFSGMLSMEPFPVSRPGPRADTAAGRVIAALRPAPPKLADFDMLPPREDLAQVKSLAFTSFDGEPLYLAALASGETKIIPVGNSQVDAARIGQIVTRAAAPTAIAERTLLTQYDAYYVDRHGERPLPVLRVALDDPDHTRLYIDPLTGQVVGLHSDHSSFVTRWLYHGLHSMDFPWLYNHRPAWDVVVLALMLGGLSVSVTSVILAWQVLRRTGSQAAWRRRRNARPSSANPARP